MRERSNVSSSQTVTIRPEDTLSLELFTGNFGASALQLGLPRQPNALQFVLASIPGAALPYCPQLFAFPEHLYQYRWKIRCTPHPGNSPAQAFKGQSLIPGAIPARNLLRPAQRTAVAGFHQHWQG